MLYYYYYYYLSTQTDRRWFDPPWIGNGSVSAPRLVRSVVYSKLRKVKMTFPHHFVHASRSQTCSNGISNSCNNTQFIIIIIIIITIIIITVFLQRAKCGSYGTIYCTASNIAVPLSYRINIPIFFLSTPTLVAGIVSNTQDRIAALVTSLGWG